MATKAPSMVLAYTRESSAEPPIDSRYLTELSRQRVAPVRRSIAVIYLSGATIYTLSAVTTGTTLPGPSRLAGLPLFHTQLSRPVLRSTERRFVSQAPNITSRPSTTGAAWQ